LGVTNFDERASDWVSHPKKVEHACVVAEATIADTKKTSPIFWLTARQAKLEIEEK
jgi:hypothetical protein